MSKRRETSRAKDSPQKGEGRDASNANAAVPTSGGAPFAVVGIGASAGGLEAFRSLLGALPAKTGMAYVVVQHLSPERPSILAKTLVRFTSMPVVEVVDGMQLAPDRVYVMPSNAEVLVADGTLRLADRPPSPGGRLPIDAVFRSLAAQLRSRAIGVVLSGTGEDGTAGLKEIKAEGGITFAQTPSSAQFGGMPEHASAAGVVDRVLPPERIASELARLSDHPYVVQPDAVERPPGDGARTLRESPLEEGDGTSGILALVRRQSGVDFSAYKPSTVRRRIARRMALHHLRSLAEYGALVGSDPSEAKALGEDLLIHVTVFFRDPSVFKALKQLVFPALLETKREGPFRFWVPGCSTGEEVYSLAMSLIEYLGDASLEIPFQIFGSDLSDRAIERARAGLYPGSALRDVGGQRVERFFAPAGEERRIVKSIRDRCVFVVHDLTRDPPFAKLDLISCRNVPIYFGAELQQRLVPMFHYCLNRPGFLLLGRSESVIGFGNLFEPVAPEHRIFSRVGEGGRIAVPATLASRMGLPLTGTTAPRAISHPAAEARRQADQLLVGRFAPPGVVVNDRLEIVQFRGRTGEFLEQPPGQPQTNLLKMARGPLAAELERAIAAARERGVAVRSAPVPVIRGDQTLPIAVEVLPLLPGRDTNDRYFLVIFHDVRAPAASPPEPDPGDAVREARRLRDELAAMKQYVESIAEQHQTTDDEFATVNEELVSANEELQSTNEELESAKEELQSANEELTTLNDELEGRNTELDRLANDLANILEAVNIPIVILDAERRVRRFTPATHALLSLAPSDVGRPIDEIKLNVDVPDLGLRIAEVMQREAPGEWEVQDASGRWFRMQIRPCRAGERGFDGAILSFVDVDVLKQTVREAQSARDYARAIVESVQVPLLVVDGGERVVSANPAFERALEGGAAVSPGDDLVALTGDSGNAEALRRAVADALAGRSLPAAVEIERGAGGPERRTFAVAVRRVEWPGGRTMALLAFEDLTERRRLEQERTARAVAETSNRSKDRFLATLSHELRTPLSTILMQAQALRRTGRTEPKVDHAAAAIERAAVLQKRLIDDLLDVSRIVSGKLGLDQHVVDLGAIVEGAVEEARPAAEAKGVALDETHPPELTAVYADPARMQQVVSNLLTNAIKFTPRGGNLSVTLDRSAAEARVTVRDTGMGIRREFLPFLFTRFTQADGTATRTHGGLGLGLAIVKHLVDLHGGTVAAHSAGPGRGATFTVTLPLVEKRAPEHALLQPPRLTGDIAGLRVLVVEDDEGTRECLVEVLGAAGVNVHAAANVPEGIEALSEFRPDVLLSDLAMPGQDGFVLIGHIRGLPPERGGTVPAAALSALAGVEDQQRALDAGFQMHIPKPVDLNGLFAAVARLAAMRPA